MDSGVASSLMTDTERAARLEEALKAVKQLRTQNEELRAELDGIQQSIDAKGKELPPGKAQRMVTMLEASLSEGALKEEHFLFKLFYQQLQNAHAKSGRATRWHPDLLDWALAVYQIGGRGVLSLLDGGMFAGGGAELKIDLSKGNFPMPSLSTLRGRVPKWLAGPGIHRLCGGGAPLRPHHRQRAAA